MGGRLPGGNSPKPFRNRDRLQKIVSAGRLQPKHRTSALELQNPPPRRLKPGTGNGSVLDGPDDDGLNLGDDSGIILQIIAEQQDVRSGPDGTKHHFLQRVFGGDGIHLQVIRHHHTVISQTPAAAAR